MTERIIGLAEKYRTAVSRVIGVIAILLLLFTDDSFERNGFADLFLTSLGIFFIGICVLGRIWASMYVAGNKTHTLVMDGPYSMVRNPLYFFSFIGTVGIGLVSENVAILALLVVLFIVYYPFVVLSEERELIRVHGDAFRAYMKRVPRFVPRFSQLADAATVDVKVSQYRRTFVEAIWFIWFIIPLQIVEILHETGVLPVLFQVP